jgi:hypothetical protein
MLCLWLVFLRFDMFLSISYICQSPQKQVFWSANTSIGMVSVSAGMIKIVGHDQDWM